MTSTALRKNHWTNKTNLSIILNRSYHIVCANYSSSHEMNWWPAEHSSYARLCGNVFEARWYRFYCSFSAVHLRMQEWKNYRASAIAASPVQATIGKPSVCPSVRPSVTRWHWVKMTQARITKSSPTDSPRTLVFGIKKFIQKFERVHP